VPAARVRGSFLWRNRVMLTSGLLLILALHLLSVGVRSDARASKPSILLMDALRPIQGFESALTDDAAGFVHDYFDLVGVRQENLRLKQQLVQFESQRALMAELAVQNHHLSDLLELRDALATRAVAANVIGSDATGLSRSLLLSEGASNGLRRDMAVISAEGVVGRLITVASDSSRALLINDHNSALDAFDQRSRARGIIAGVIEDGLRMKYVDRSEDVKLGDTIITSGMDAIFPRGLLVGRVVRVSPESRGLFLTVEVRPAVDFRKIEQVLVLTQKPPRLAAETTG
jgi:rod shape-determining protein MreC